MKSKAEGIGWLVQKTVNETINNLITGAVQANDMDGAKTLARFRFEISKDARERISEPCAMLELADIMKWKKPREA